MRRPFFFSLLAQTSHRWRLDDHESAYASRGNGNGSQHAGAAAARFGVKVGERVWRVNGRAVGEALNFQGVIELCRRRPVALDLVGAEA